MEALVQELFPSSDSFVFRQPSILVDPRNDLQQIGDMFEYYPALSNVSDPVERSSSEGYSSSKEHDSPQVERDFSDAMYKYITQMLMEEDDLEKKPCMFHDCMALQAAEKYFSDALHGSENNSQLVIHQSPITQDWLTGTSSSPISDISSDGNTSSIESQWVHDKYLSLESPDSQYFQSHLQSWSSLKSSSGHVTNGLDDSSLNTFQVVESFGNGQYKGITEDAAHFFQSGSSSTLTNGSPSRSREKKNHHREDDDAADQQRSNKQLATFTDDCEPMEMYDNVLLCQNIPCVEHNGASSSSDECSPKGAKKATKGRPKGSRKHGSRKKEMVDLRGLLTQCAQAMANYDSRTGNELLMRIRQHSSPHGDGTERLSHYLANALEARLSGTGTALYTAFASSRISAAHILKAYKTFITACPFKLLSNIFANKYIIRKLVATAPTIHIIDFGILYGFQWPCLIQGLSLRAGGPPKLRITGIDLPQPGFRPAERVEDTGRRLEKYCNRFNVPFKFKAIAKKWENITLEELEINRDEVLVVNCLYRLGNIPDETVVPNSPRDTVLDLIKRIRPDMFIHGVLNGTFNTPFFVTRFREALFHFSSLFDMFEATIPRESEDRKLLEEEVFGRDAMNVIACEGTERVERPETYKQWQLRSVRAGFKQLPLDQEIVKLVKDKVRSDYHKDFSVDEDGRWMLQGWKGRVLYALSCWKPAQHS